MNGIATDQPCLIRRGPLAGLTGLVIGWEGERVLIRFECLPGVHLAMPPEAIEILPVA